MAIVISGIIIIFMAVLFDIRKVAAVADVMILLLFVLVNLSMKTEQLQIDRLSSAASAWG